MHNIGTCPQCIALITTVSNNVLQDVALGRTISPFPKIALAA